MFWLWILAARNLVRNGESVQILREALARDVCDGIQSATCDGIHFSGYCSGSLKKDNINKADAVDIILQ